MTDIIELIFDENDPNWGVECISLVDSPAIEEDFIALNKHKVVLKAVDDEKHLAIGLALIPKKLIYRNANKEEGFEGEKYIWFASDTIRKVAQSFLIHKQNNNPTKLQHETTVSDVDLVESWIVEDTKKDKTAFYNLKAPVGSWAVAYSVKNTKVWKAIKDGIFNGFSIEGNFMPKVDITKEDKAMDDFLNSLGDGQKLALAHQLINKR